MQRGDFTLSAREPETCEQTDMTEMTRLMMTVTEGTKKRKTESNRARLRPNKSQTWDWLLVRLQDRRQAGLHAVGLLQYVIMISNPRHADFNKA